MNSPGYRFLSDDVDGTVAPQTDSKDTTDAHLVVLAKRHGMKLATLEYNADSQILGVGCCGEPATTPIAYAWPLALCP